MAQPLPGLKMKSLENTSAASIIPYVQINMTKFRQEKVRLRTLQTLAYCMSISKNNIQIWLYHQILTIFVDNICISKKPFVYIAKQNCRYTKFDYIYKILKFKHFNYSAQVCLKWSLWRSWETLRADRERALPYGTNKDLSSAKDNTKITRLFTLSQNALVGELCTRDIMGGKL